MNLLDAQDFVKAMAEDVQYANTKETALLRLVRDYEAWVERITTDMDMFSVTVITDGLNRARALYDLGKLGSAAARQALEEAQQEEAQARKAIGITVVSVHPQHKKENFQ